MLYFDKFVSDYFYLLVESIECKHTSGDAKRGE